MNYKLLKVLFSILIPLTALLSCAGGGTAGTGGGSELKGIIKDTNQLPLQNVTVTNLNSQEIDISDNSGGFTFTIPREGGQIQVRFEGSGLSGALVTVDIPASNGEVFVVFTGNTSQNTVVESGIRIEDRNDDSDDGDDDSIDDSDNDSLDDQDDNEDDHGGNSGSDDDRNQDSDSGSSDDSDNDEDDSNDESSGNSGSNSGSGSNNSGSDDDKPDDD